MLSISCKLQANIHKKNQPLQIPGMIQGLFISSMAKNELKSLQAMAKFPTESSIFVASPTERSESSIFDDDTCWEPSE